ncbi:MAG TPA: DUF4126 domain-containing protein [Acidimicrobiia bacterium]|nr:DUF4126 domain-containing protein [Acidimicrobiia bacterium]
MELGLIAGSGWAAGLNVYGVVLVLGLMGRLTDNALPDQLSSTPVLIAAGVLYAVEFFADKVPYLDNVWDAIHTVIRPVAAGWIGYLLAGEVGMSEALGAGTSGVIALASHSVKATTRAAVNVSPEPASNIALSVLEDGLVAGVVALAVAYPIIALVLVIVLLAAGSWLVFVLWRAIGRVWQRIAVRTGAPG